MHFVYVPMTCCHGYPKRDGVLRESNREWCRLHIFTHSQIIRDANVDPQYQGKYVSTRKRSIFLSVFVLLTMSFFFKNVMLVVLLLTYVGKYVFL